MGKIGMFLNIWISKLNLRLIWYCGHIEIQKDGRVYGKGRVVMAIA